MLTQILVDRAAADVCIKPDGDFSKLGLPPSPPNVETDPNGIVDHAKIENCTSGELWSFGFATDQAAIQPRPTSLAVALNSEKLVTRQTATHGTIPHARRKLLGW